MPDPHWPGIYFTIDAVGPSKELPPSIILPDSRLFCYESGVNEPAAKTLSPEPENEIAFLCCPANLWLADCQTEHAIMNARSTAVVGSHLVKVDSLRLLHD